MRVLYDTIMITYIYYEPTDPYYLTSKVLGCILKRNSQILCFFAFQPLLHILHPDIRLFKYVVTRPLYNTIMMTYIYYVQIDQYYPTGKEFDFNLESKTRILLLFCFLAFSIHTASRCQTYKINSHKASV